MVEERHDRAARRERSALDPTVGQRRRRRRVRPLARLGGRVEEVSTPLLVDCVHAPSHREAIARAVVVAAEAVQRVGAVEQAERARPRRREIADHGRRECGVRFPPDRPQEDRARMKHRAVRVVRLVEPRHDARDWRAQHARDERGEKRVVHEQRDRADHDEVDHDIHDRRGIDREVLLLPRARLHRVGLKLLLEVEQHDERRREQAVHARHARQRLERPPAHILDDGDPVARDEALVQLALPP